MSGMRIAAVTYNVHDWIGTDGRRDRGRCLEVLAGTGADVAGLQEAGFPLGDMEAGARELAEQTGMSAVLGPTLERGRSHFGNVLLSSFPVIAVRRHDISMPGKEPRGILDADLDVAGRIVRVMVTHFGLRAWERRAQARQFVEAFSGLRREITIVLGDFNEWFRAARPLGLLRGTLGMQDAPRTFPSLLPLFALDRIWVAPKNILAGVRACTGGKARLASDHLPLMAEIDLG